MYLWSPQPRKWEIFFNSSKPTVFESISVEEEKLFFILLDRLLKPVWRPVPLILFLLFPPFVRSWVVVPDTKKFPTVTILDGKLVRARASHRDPSLLNNNDCLYDNLVSFSPLFAALTTSVGQILDQWVDGTWVKNAARQSRKSDQTIDVLFLQD